MPVIEHLIGISRAAGYDEADVRELIEWLNNRPAVAFAVLLDEPAATPGAVQAGNRMAAAILAVETRDDRTSWDELLAARSAWLANHGGQ